MLEKGQFAVSTSTFIDLGNPVKDGMSIIGARMRDGLYAPEIEQAVDVANEHNIGLEVAYRVGLPEYYDLLKTVKGGILQIHGPIFSNIADATRHGWIETSGNPFVTRLKQAVMNPVIGRFAQGTIDRDWEAVRDSHAALSARNVVLHPRGPQRLLQIGAKTDGVIIGIEPDFQRLHPSEYIVWRLEDVMEIAEQTNAGIIIDISHATISLNTLETLPDLYAHAKKAPKGVVGIHFNVAIPSGNRQDFFTKGTASRPLYRNTPDHAKGPILEFYQEVTRDPDFTGPFVLEFWSFGPLENTPDNRRRAVGETLEVLAGSTVPPRSYSSPGTPTTHTY